MNSVTRFSLPSLFLFLSLCFPIVSVAQPELSNPESLAAAALTTILTQSKDQILWNVYRIVYDESKKNELYQDWMLDPEDFRNFHTQANQSKESHRKTLDGLLSSLTETPKTDLDTLPPHAKAKTKDKMDQIIQDLNQNLSTGNKELPSLEKYEHHVVELLREVFLDYCPSTPVRTEKIKSLADFRSIVNYLNPRYRKFFIAPVANPDTVEPSR